MSGAVVTLTHTLTDQEVRVLAFVRQYQTDHCDAPTGREVIGRKGRDFHRLIKLDALGLLAESGDGKQRVTLTEAGERVLNTLSIDNAHHWAGEPQ